MSTTTLKAGDEVRIIKTGQAVILDEINPNPNYADDDEVWCDSATNANGTLYIIDSPDDVELLRRAADIPAKKLPTPKELVDAFSSSLHSGFSETDIDETDTGGEPEGQFLAYGTSSTGRRFGCRVTITEIEETDF
jgi:hypothetical protein